MTGRRDRAVRGIYRAGWGTLGAVPGYTRLAELALIRATRRQT